MKTAKTFEKGRFALVGILLGVAASLVTAPADAETVWVHGTLSAKSDAGFLFMAQRRFAEKLGIKLKIVQLKGDPLLLKALLAGEIDSYEGNPSSPMAAFSRGADVKILGCHWQVLTYALFVKKDGPVKTIADLKGKKIGVSTPGALPDIFARGALEQARLKPTDVQFVAAGNDADRIAAIADGTVDAAASSSEFVPILEKQGLRMLIHAEQATPNFVRFCMYTTGKVLATKRDAAVRFIAAEMRGFDYALKHKKETLALAREISEAPAGDPRAEYLYDEVLRYKSIDPTFSVPLANLKWIQGLLMGTGLLDRPVDLNSMIDTRVRVDAMRLAGLGR